MAILTPTNLDYLIDSLRLHLGDIDPTKYRYMDEWLRTSLVLSVKTLQKWWEQKYLVDELGNVYRNTLYSLFSYPEPPLIQNEDERPIILMASIIIKQGSLENSSWSVGTWRDAEIYYSNTELGKLKLDSLKADWEDLQSILKAPQKKLLGALKSTLPGFKLNPWETSWSEIERNRK
jgi:hypothetical protein